MYYLRRFVAQGIDAVLIILIGAVVFYGFSHSPVGYSGGEWTFSPSSMYPSRTGWGFAYTFPEGEEEDQEAEPVESSQRIRLFHREWSGGVIDVSVNLDDRWGLYLLYACYYTFFTGFWGQTVGKRLMRLQVVGKDGQRVGYGRALGRWLGYFLSGLPLYLGLLWIFVRWKRLAWHDWVCGTRVMAVE